MKKLLIMLMVVAMASFLFVGCQGVTPEPEPEPEPGTELQLVGITVDPNTMELFVGGKGIIDSDSVTATYEIRGYDVPIELEDCLFLTSDSEVATVAEAANVVTVTAEGVGTANILVSYEGKVDTLVVTVSEKQHSTYAFEYKVPEEDILVNGDVKIPVTFKTTEEKELGYKDVRFKFAATGPVDGNVTFKATDSLGNVITQTNSGFWGPSEGFDIPVLYSASTDWTLNFDIAGVYKITFSLIDATDVDEPVVDGITGSQELIVYATN